MKSRGDEGQASVRVEWKEQYGWSVQWQSEKLRRGVVLTPGVQVVEVDVEVDHAELLPAATAPTELPKVAVCVRRVRVR